MKRLSYEELISDLIKKLDNTKNRYLIALAGPPASGKTTVSEKITKDLNLKGYPSNILQMDAFHYDNGILENKGLLSKKGSSETFDVMGLKNFLNRLNDEDEVIVPIFDRSLELSKSSAVIISKKTRVIIVEGNYLLLNSEPWKKLHNYFQSKIIIDCEEKIREERLIKRWENFNLSKEEIHKKVYENDLPNGFNVLKNSIEADYTLIN
ncbi:AAA family ATPase [Candidatus Pelagibacter sp.]|uniref:AAA family ATPase n=1 Tax=Candidatus Pelagibacter sp. TaxID=2024849 RepID=UPI003F827DDD